ncbi:hypothetical protein LTR55_011953, partial [Exophiala xenobiotica]
AINDLAVGAYGEAEFWLSGGKVILIFSLFLFTFITMVGGNPHGDAYGFRHFENVGAFREYIATGDLGRFEGFLAALASALFTVVGPEYISMVAAEAKRPRVYLKAAFKMVYLRFGIFFIGGALAVGIVCGSRDPKLADVVLGGSSGSAAASPYVIAMQNMGIDVFPSIVNAEKRDCLNAFAKPGHKFGSLTYPGSPHAGLIDYFVMCVMYIFFYRACKAQGLDRNKLPYTGWFQPYCACIAATWLFVVTCMYGYTCYLPWSVSSFFSQYSMQLFIPPLFVIWKVLKKTKMVKAHETDLVWQRPFIDAYEATFIDPPSGFWKEMVQLVGFKRTKGGQDRRRRGSSLVVV